MNDHNTTTEQLTAELVELRQRLYTLMSNLPGMAYRCRNDPQWSMEFVSEGCSNLTGYQASDLTNNRTTAYGDLIHPADRQSVYDQVQRALAQRQRFQMEYRIRTAAGEERWVWEQGIGVFSGTGELQFLEGFITDITERKRAEEALKQAHDESLRQSERRFRNYFEQGLVGMAATSVDEHWLEVNDRLCQMLGYRRDELLQTTWTALTFPEDLEKDLDQLHDVLTGKIEHYALDKRFVGKGGKLVHTTIHVRAFRKDDGSIDHLVKLMEDITERKLAEEAVERERQSLWRMLQASDHERQIIAYEIHDGPAQYLAAAGMQFQSFDALRETSPDKATRAYQTAVELVRQSYIETRRLISQVRPPIIDEIGLEMAISHLVHETRRRGGPKIHFDSNVQFERLASILENALYRIAQEALTNACKHSQSKKVTVSLSQEGQEAWLKVQDWGIGFDPESVEKGHFGLEGIRQRVRLLGGRLTIESTPGAGTMFQVVVPILEKWIEG